MKLLALLLLCWPAFAHAAPPELECDGARVEFQDRWLRGSRVIVEGNASLELPWTGREKIKSGHRLRAERTAEMSSTEEAAQDSLLLETPEETQFVVFSEQLLIDRDLLAESEHDGLVIVREARSKTVVFHCRSR